MPSLLLPTFLRSAVFWASPSRMLVSSSTLKDGECLSLSMSGCMLLLRASPADTRGPGLPAIARLCLASEERDFQPSCSEPWTALRSCVQHELLRAECQLSLLGRKARP